MSPTGCIWMCTAPTRAANAASHGQTDGLAMKLRPAGLDGVVGGSGAHILGRWHAGEHLKLVHGLQADIQGHRAVVALLVDRL